MKMTQQQEKMRLLERAIGTNFVMLSLLLGQCAAVVDKPRRVGIPEEIRIEATRPNDSAVGKPLPLAMHWSCGEHVGRFKGQEMVGFSPAYQMQMIEKGHYLLPWFSGNCEAWPEEQLERYYDAPMKRAAALKLPISFVSTQWECWLTYDKKYLDLPPDKNPNVVGVDGKVSAEVSPFGPVGPWREVGARWGSCQVLRRLQEWYPDPPLVVFISNNEHAKLMWNRVEEDRRYLESYGKDRDANFKRKVVSEGWIERYRALQAGFREGLNSSEWKKKALFVGYDAFGPPHFARWSGWDEYSLYVPGRIDPAPLTWDGGSPSYYTHPWNDSTDYRVWSPQIESMNWVFMLKEAYKLNPRFWFEISVWDGNHSPAIESDKRNTYARLGQKFTPERYGGFVQFGMWLLRPRVVREFRDWTDTVAHSGPYFMALVEAVDRVHTNPILRSFWRKGQLVPNRTRPHPYQADVPEEYRNADRWFLLQTTGEYHKPSTLNPKGKWGLLTEIPVFSLALVQGQGKQRQWLVYANAPLREQKEVGITIPDYGEIIVNVEVGGSFFLVDEKTQSVKRVP